MRVIEALTMVPGGVVVLAQAIPGVPDDFKSWPVTAILGLITLSALIAGVIERRMSAKALSDLAVSVTRLAMEQGESNVRMNELAMKLGHGNDLQVATLANLQARPCIADEFEEAIRKLKKTQRI